MPEILEKNIAEKSPEEQLQEFRAEIGLLKDVEMEKKKDWESRGKERPAYDSHFDDIESDYLGGFEQKLYDEYKKGDLSEKRIEELGKAADQHYSPIYSHNMESPVYQSISAFWAYIRNEVIKREAKRKLKEIKAKRELKEKEELEAKKNNASMN